MKPDIVTVALLVLCAGVILSVLGSSRVVQAESQQPPSALQQGIAVR